MKAKCIEIFYEIKTAISFKNYFKLNLFLKMQLYVKFERRKKQLLNIIL